MRAHLTRIRRVSDLEQFLQLCDVDGWKRCDHSVVQNLVIEEVWGISASAIFLALTSIRVRRSAHQELLEEGESQREELCKIVGGPTWV